MTSDSWRRVDELYHAALEIPATDRARFLERECGGDETIRREVESLLNQPTSTPFLETPAAAVAGDLVDDRDHAPLVGQVLGTYTLVSLLGRGGMGEVYRARDNTLRRDVAIKLLPAALAHDPTRRARFAREARMLAALHHPHIATIFGVDETSGVVALVMELVEGPTLADRIARGRIAVAEALPIAKQIAEALDAAHEKGIVHRDLKPANIKLTKDGTVKVLDFGLGRALSPETANAIDVATTMRSEPGTVLGTPAYMSPEQARGQAVDKRTDIWAFGCVLYEMLAGRPAFDGPTVSDVLSNVLQREPDWAALPSSVPADVVRVLRRCLDKDLRRRSRDIADVRAHLEDVGAVAPIAARESRSRLGMAAAVLGAIAMLMAVGAWVWFRGASTPADTAFVNWSVEPVTTDPGYTAHPALSPDGRLLAYASDRSGAGNLDVWVQQTSGGTPLRLTDDVADDDQPDFSPDGSQIVFRSERNGGGVYIVPALGGMPRLLAAGGRNPKFSPDGSRIAYWTGQFRGRAAGLDSLVYVLPLFGGMPVRLMSNFTIANHPVWAPDSRSLLVIGRRTRDAAEAADWWRTSADGGEATRTGLMDWNDLRAESFQSAELGIGPWISSGFLIARGGNLWMLPLAATGRLSGAPTQLTLGTAPYAAPTATRDGQIMFGSATITRNVERLPLGSTSSTAQVLYADGNKTSMRASTSLDGRTIVFERLDGLRHEIWAKDMATGAQHVITAVDTPVQVNATVSPDGSRASYVVVDPQGRNAAEGTGFVVDLSGGVPRRVCDHCTPFGFLSDSRRVIVLERGTSLRFVSVDHLDAAPSMVIKSGLDRPSIPPNQRSIAFREANTRRKIYVAPLVEGRPVKESEWTEIDDATGTGRPCGWSPDSSTLYLLLDADGFRDLWGQKVDAGRPIGKPFLVHHFHDVTGMSTSLGNAISKEGFLYEGARRMSNIWRLVPATKSPRR